MKTEKTEERKNMKKKLTKQRQTKFRRTTEMSPRCLNKMVRWYQMLSDTLCIQKMYWIITVNGKINVCKCKLLFPTDTIAKDKQLA